MALAIDIALFAGLSLTDAPESILELFKPACALNKMRQVAFSMDAAQRQWIASVVIEAGPSRDRTTVARSFYRPPHAPVLPAVRVTERIDLMPEYYLKPLFRLT
jgi:hypothetical protein